MWPFTKSSKQKPVAPVVKSSKQKPVAPVVAPPPKVVQGSMPSGDVVARFIPIETFTSDEFANSVYHAGEVYSIRMHNLKLAQCVHKWESQNKVEVLIDRVGDPLVNVINTGEQV